MKLLRLVGPFLLFTLAVSPQTTDPVIHVDVNLRQVDLIVTDANGNHVSDLQPTDFQLLEDGKPQQLTNFSWVEVTPPPSGSRLAALQEKPSLLEKLSGVARFRQTPGNDVLSAPVANLRKEEIRRTIAIVAGDITVPAMDRIRKFIDEQVGPGDMVSVRSVLRAVTVNDNGMLRVHDSAGIFQQYTNDKRQLDAATERLPRICTYRTSCFADMPWALTSAIRSLQDLPGRKALLFVGRYRQPIENIINLANRAGVVIYVLDDVGVGILGDIAPESERVLAEKTGGRRILSTVGFDLTTGFNEVIEDLSGYYLLGYHPAAPDPLEKTPRHKIEVKVLRAGLTVRVRDGLMGAPNPIAPPPGRDDTLASALTSVFTHDAIRTHLEPLFGASSPNRKKKRSPLVRAVLDIDGRDVVFADADGGKKKMTLDVAVIVLNEDGSQAGAANKTFPLVVSKEQAAGIAIAKASLQYKLDVALTKPGPYQVRAAVRDATSGEVGSTYAFLDIPDFNRPKISLSSLVLSPSARQGWNEFTPGATVQYVAEVFGLKPPPDVETEVKLYRGGSPVAGIPPSPVKIENVGDQSFLTGAMRIPGDLAAGNYTMELLAHENKQVTRQWTDVTVLTLP